MTKDQLQKRAKARRSCWQISIGICLLPRFGAADRTGIGAVLRVENDSQPVNAGDRAGTIAASCAAVG